MNLAERIELLHRSSERLMEAVKLPRDDKFWWFMRRELWVHLKRSFEALWHALWR